MDCIVHGVTKSWTQLSDFHFYLQALLLKRSTLLWSSYFWWIHWNQRDFKLIFQSQTAKWKWSEVKPGSLMRGLFYESPCNTDLFCLLKGKTHLRSWQTHCVQHLAQDLESWRTRTICQMESKSDFKIIRTNTSEVSKLTKQTTL